MINHRSAASVVVPDDSTTTRRSNNHINVGRTRGNGRGTLPPAPLPSRRRQRPARTTPAAVTAQCMGQRREDCVRWIKCFVFVAIQCFMYWEYSQMVVRKGQHPLNNNMMPQQQTANKNSSPPPPPSNPKANSFYGIPPISWGPLSLEEGGNNTMITGTNSQPQQSKFACTKLRWKYNNDKPNAPIVHKPMFVPSFPGSGAELFRKLVFALTGGIQGWSVYDSDKTMTITSTTSTATEEEEHAARYETCHSLLAITCKTHWPVLPQQSPHHIPFFINQYHSSVIVLLRNPMAAFASRLNHLWETNTKTKFHSTQAPERAWNRWISTQFETQVLRYQEFITAWVPASTISSSSSSSTKKNGTTATLMRSPPSTSTGHSETNNNGNNDNNATIIVPFSSPYQVALYLPYEKLVHPTEGPEWAQKIAHVLEQANVSRVITHGDDATDKDDITTTVKNNINSTCLWKYTVLDRPTMKRSTHSYRPGYTLAQQTRLIQMLDELQTTIAVDVPPLQAILIQYRQDIQTTMRIVEEEYQTQFNKKKKKKKHQT